MKTLLSFSIIIAAFSIVSTAKAESLGCHAILEYSPEFDPSQEAYVKLALEEKDSAKGWSQLGQISANDAASKGEVKEANDQGCNVCVDWYEDKTTSAGYKYTNDCFGPVKK